MNTIKFCASAVAALAFALPAFASGNGDSADSWVVLHSDAPGSLRLSDEAMLSPKLKVTGDIDARDLKTLKKVTINVTRELDLSEASIAAYFGTDGCIAEITSDWMVTDPKPVDYPADYFPTNAFVEVRNNSLSKWKQGSSTLWHLILPSSLKGFMKEAFTYNPVLCEIDVPSSSTTLSEIDGVIYSFDKSTLITVPPVFYGDITVPATVTNIAADALREASPASITFEGSTVPEIGDGNSVDTGYVVSSDPEGMKTIFPDTDCISSLDMITVENVTPGTLMAKIADMGHSRSSVRAITATGRIDYEEFLSLFELPNLHVADLSGVVVEVSNYPELWFSCPTLTSFSFPSFSNDIALRIGDNTKLHGHLDVPEGTYWVEITSPRFSSVTFPASLSSISSNSLDSSLVREVDFSDCTSLDIVQGMHDCGLLATVRLPEGLEKIDGIHGPVTSINLPSTLKSVVSYGNWKVEELVLPASLTKFWIDRLPGTRKIDASGAVNLLDFNGLQHAPLLKELDLSMCPIYSINVFAAEADIDPATPSEPESVKKRLVISGGTLNPATNVVGIETLRLPSSLVNLYGLSHCTRLKELDLIGCYALEKIQGINNCRNLAHLTLPASAPSITGLMGCPSLREVVSASRVAPRYSAPEYYDDDVAPLDFHGISLTVPDGATGAYRMAQDWENCDVKEGGKTVTASLSRCAHLFDTVNHPLIDGAGLYPAGTEVTLFAHPAADMLECRGWQVGDTDTMSNPLEITVTEDVTVSPLYEIEAGRSDLIFTLYAEDYVTVPVYIWSGRREVYLNNELINSLSSGSSGVDLEIMLQPGENEFAINTDELIINFFAGEALRSSDSDYTVTDFRANRKESLLHLNASNFDMDRLDLNGFSNLEMVSYNNPGRISALSASNCPKLYYLNLSGHQMETAELGDGLGVQGLSLNDNLLKSLDVTPLSALLTVSAENNRLEEFSFDNPLCDEIYLNFNNMAFSSLSERVYEVYADMAEKYGEEVHYVYFEPDMTKIQNEGILDLSGEQFAPDSSVPVMISINGGEKQNLSETDGIIRLQSGEYEIILTSDAYPGVAFKARFYCDVTGVESVTDLSGIAVNGRTVSADGLAAGSVVRLFAADGSAVAEAVAGADGSVAAEVPASGIYLLTIESAGTTRTAKISVR